MQYLYSVYLGGRGRLYSVSRELTRDPDALLAACIFLSDAGRSVGKGSLNIERTEFASVRLGGCRSLPSAPSAPAESVTMGAICSNHMSRNRSRERLICTSRSVCSTFTLGMAKSERGNTSIDV